MWSLEYVCLGVRYIVAILHGIARSIEYCMCEALKYVLPGWPSCSVTESAYRVCSRSIFSSMQGDFTGFCVTDF